MLRPREAPARQSSPPGDPTQAPGERPFWLDAAPAAPRRAQPLPEATDVAVIGGGYTGVSAARSLARRGIEVTVLEGRTLGWGASTRNGGFVLPGFKLDPERLLARFGGDLGRRLFEASLAAVRFLEELIAEESIACEYERCGHLALAAKPAHLARLEASGRCLSRDFGYGTRLLSRADLAAELDSTAYHGGLLDPRAGSLQPASYFAGLAAAAERAGAQLCEAAEVRELARLPGGFALTTSRGRLRASHVLVATNGYSGDLEPWLRRRVVPVGSYLVATAPLPAALARQLIPRRRVLSDSKNLLHYFRLSNDDRLLFGGRASFTPATPARSARILAAELRAVFPQLAATGIEYSWSGNVGFTRDQLPHAGRLGGVHYALGYCGHGVALATYLGARVAEAIAGRGDLEPFAELGFPAIPGYRKRPWFLPLVGAYFRCLDRLR